MIFFALLFATISFALFYFFFSPFGLGPTPSSFLPKNFFDENRSDGLSDTLTLLAGGEKAFSEILRLINEANHSVWVQVFIFKSDEIGTKIVEALIAAADRGVAVTVSKDVVGTFFELGDLLAGRPSPVYAKGGLNAHPKIAVKTDFFRPTDHSKYYIFDGEVAVFGGMNIADEYHKKWLDYMVKIDGEKWASALADKGIDGKSWPAEAPFYLATNSRKRCEIKRGFLEVFGYAKEKIILLHAYVSESDILSALIAAARRGVMVELILPKAPGTHYFANLESVNRLLGAGVGDNVKIFHYPEMSHAKVALIDDRIVIAGSANLTHRSMRRSVEMSIFVRGDIDTPFVRELKESLALVREKSERITEPFAMSRFAGLSAFTGKYTW